MCLEDAFISWGAFWYSYFLLSMFFKFRYKTITKDIVYEDIFRNITKNMIFTGLFQPVLYLLVPKGILDPQYVIYRFVISALITEIIFFYSHYLFHHKSLYKYHKVHHEFVEPCALSALYCHPYEALFCNQLSTAVGPLITGMNTHELVIWSFLIALNVLKAHSGSKKPFFNSKYHDLHHKKRNINFGFLYFLDIFHGTCQLPKEKIN